MNSAFLVLITALFLLASFSIYMPATGRAALADSEPSAQLLFKNVVTDSDGSKYLIGDIQNNEPGMNIDATTFFSKSNLSGAYYSQEVGVIPKGMGVPFKINLADAEKQANSSFNLSDFKIGSEYTSQVANNLEVNYSSLYMDQQSHAMTGTLDNKSPMTAYDVRVLAIALDSHSRPLDVVKSDIISAIPSNGSAFFKLVPLDSVARNVSLYSCFVPSSAGSTYNVSIGNGQTMQLLFNGDGKIKNLHYDAQNRNLTFVAQGIFLSGGSEEGMILTGPDSFTSSKLVLALNGQNVTNGVQAELVGGKAYKHFEFNFPFGKNTVSVLATSEVPEFSATLIVTVGAIGSVILLGYIFRKMNFS